MRMLITQPWTRLNDQNITVTNVVICKDTYAQANIYQVNVTVELTYRQNTSYMIDVNLPCLVK